MFNATDQQELNNRYVSIANTGASITADTVLRGLEIEFALRLMDTPATLLDVGCGYGETTRLYAKYVKHVTGIDTIADNNSIYTQKMSLFDVSHNYDIITSHRCIMSILSWEQQARAITHLFNHLNPGGMLILFEGFVHGLYGLNGLRTSVGLPPIPGDGRDRLMTLRFKYDTFDALMCDLNCSYSQCGFDTYYLLTRVYYPLLIHPDAPEYNTHFHKTAAKIQLHNQVDLDSISLETCTIITKPRG